MKLLWMYRAFQGWVLEATSKEKLEFKCIRISHWGFFLMLLMSYGHEVIYLMVVMHQGHEYKKVFSIKNQMKNEYVSIRFNLIN